MFLPGADGPQPAQRADPHHLPAVGGRAAQIVDGPIKKVTILGAGTLSRHNLAPVSAEALAGILSSRTSGITVVNAMAKAKDFNINVKEVAEPDSKEFTSMLTIELETALAASDRPEELLLALRGFSKGKGQQQGGPQSGRLRLSGGGE